MNEIYKNNPLHSLKLETLLTELVDYYGFEILAAATNFNCFRMNPNIKGSLKFLKKSEWARHRLEDFYLYRYKNLPKPNQKDRALSPRDRIIPDNQKPGEPEVLTIEMLLEEKAEREKNARDFDAKKKRRPAASGPWKNSSPKSKPARSKQNSTADLDPDNPWASAKKRFDQNK